MNRATILRVILFSAIQSLLAIALHTGMGEARTIGPARDGRRLAADVLLRPADLSRLGRSDGGRRGAVPRFPDRIPAPRRAILPVAEVAWPVANGRISSASPPRCWRSTPFSSRWWRVMWRAARARAESTGRLAWMTAFWLPLAPFVVGRFDVVPAALAFASAVAWSEGRNAARRPVRGPRRAGEALAGRDRGRRLRRSRRPSGRPRVARDDRLRRSSSSSARALWLALGAGACWTRSAITPSAGSRSARSPRGCSGRRRDGLGGRIPDHPRPRIARTWSRPGRARRPRSGSADPGGALGAGLLEGLAGRGSRVRAVLGRGARWRSSSGARSFRRNIWSGSCRSWRCSTVGPRDWPARCSWRRAS